MKIVLAAPSMQIGGAEKLVVSLARELAARGETVAVSGPPGPLDEALPAGTTRFELTERGRSVSGAAVSAVRLARFARAFRPDVIHAHNVKVSATASLAARLLPRTRPRVVATFHGVVPAEYRAAARILRAADAVACVSEDLRERLVAAGHPRRNVWVVRNAVEPAAPLSAQRRAQLDAALGLDERPLIASVGRLVPEKAHHRLLDALALLLRKVGPVRLLIVGEGPLRPELEQQAGSLGLRDAVTFTGLRHDARDLIARADLLVLTSDSEGLPLAALEALAAGVPVVSTDVPGMGELLGSGAGTLVRAFSAEAVARAVADLLRDPAQRERQADEGRRVVAASYSLDGMVEGYLGLYRRR